MYWGGELASSVIGPLADSEKRETLALLLTSTPASCRPPTLPQPIQSPLPQRRGPQPTLGDSYESDKMVGGSPFVSAEAVLSAEAVIYESAARAALRAEALAREAEEATRRENSMQKRQLDGRVCFDLRQVDGGSSTKPKVASSVWIQGAQRWA